MSRQDAIDEIAAARKFDHDKYLAAKRAMQTRERFVKLAAPFVTGGLAGSLYEVITKYFDISLRERSE